MSQLDKEHGGKTDTDKETTEVLCDFFKSVLCRKIMTLQHSPVE